MNGVATDNRLRRVSRDEAQSLLADCLAYVAATGMAPSSFRYRACKRAGLISDLKVGRRPTRMTVDRVRAWLAGTAHDQAEPKVVDAIMARQAKDAEAAALDARRAAAEQARAEHVQACQRREADRVAAAVQSKMMATPNDAIWTVRRRWPDLWRRIVDTARSRGELPGAVLVEAIERGLAA